MLGKILCSMLFFCAIYSTDNLNNTLVGVPVELAIELFHPEQVAFCAQVQKYNSPDGKNNQPISHYNYWEILCKLLKRKHSKDKVTVYWRLPAEILLEKYIDYD